MADNINKYQRLTPREHILKRSGMYIGNKNNETCDMYICNDDFSKIFKKTILFNAGFIKLYDEILTNASDHYVRSNGKVKNIKINIDKKNNAISIYNDGPGIPIKKKDNIWIPQMLFGELLTGENYDDTEERFVGGMNGIGSCAVNILSKKFIVDCHDGENKYNQIFENNLEITNQPKIIKEKNKSYTQITYFPDLLFFDKKDINDDDIAFMRKRAYDIALYCKCNVYFNDVKININSLIDYAKLHLPNNNDFFYEKLNDNYEIVLTQCENNTFNQCSIVNGISTYKGGTHVDYIMNNIIKRLIEDLTKGNKGLKIKSSDIKNSFHLFLVCRIANPIFDSQTKENLSIKITDKIDLSDKLYKLLLKSDIIKSILEWVQMKEQMELNKMNKKVAGRTVRVEKLVDAHKAGTSESLKCNLVLAEGDSAAGISVTGISVVGREYWGVFPLKGRPLNVREAAISKITQNEEISKILQIVGLIPGKKYKDLSELRYGKLVFMTDADHFGLSIKGLLINLIHKMWPELLKLGFCYEFITPIIIAKKGKDKKEYYDIEKYKLDKENKKLEGWSIKYYKGLGTILPVEIKEMFKNIDKHLIKFNYIEDRDNDKIDMVFNKDRVSDRKEWMKLYKGEIIPNKFNKPNEINNFIDTEFIQFSIYDTIINIPHLMDGFKPTQRKIIFSAFKKNLKEEMKVAQFGSYVAEQTHYNHGENNISGTIVNMAQDITGTNNINLLMPNGGYGTRRDPKASASPRYIYTELNKLTRKIFRIEDDQILNYLYEDTDQIEPDFYLPIIPMLLVNGTDGIGTGWSTSIPKYNPDALIEVIKRKIKKPELKYRINPWYKNHDGDIDFNEDKNSYITKGVFTRTKKGVLITELPIEVWTEKYISHLDKLCDDKIIKTYIDNSNDTTVKIDVIFNNDNNWTNDDIESKLKLTSSISINNMHTFLNNKIVKWNTAEDILNTWFDIRLKYYTIRKDKHTIFLQKQLDKQLNVYAFIDAIIKEELIINKKTKDQILSQLKKMEFDLYDDSYDYLLNIPVYSFSKDKLDTLKEDIISKKQILKEYKALEPGDIWSSELDELRKEIEKLNK